MWICPPWKWSWELQDWLPELQMEPKNFSPRNLEALVRNTNIKLNDFEVLDILVAQHFFSKASLTFSHQKSTVNTCMTIFSAFCMLENIR